MAASGALWAALLWIALVVVMGASDSLTRMKYPQKVTIWLVAFFVGLVGTILLLDPDAYPVLLVLAGGFVGPYSLTWQLFERHRGNVHIFPVSLWPFGINASEWAWYAMMGFGFALVAIGVYWLVP